MRHSSISPTLEALEQRQLLANAFLLRLDENSHPGPWFPLTSEDVHAPTKTSLGMIDIAAPLSFVSGSLLPAVQKQTPFSGADFQEIATINGKPKIEKAEHFSSVKVTQFGLSGGLTISEIAGLRFSSEKNTTNSASIAIVTPSPTVTGPVEVKLTEPKTAGNQSFAYGPSAFSLSVTPTQGQMQLETPMESSARDLGFLSGKGHRLFSSDFLVRRPTSSKHVYQAFKIGTVNVTSVDFHGTGSGAMETVHFNFSSISLNYTLPTSPPQAPLTLEPPATGLNFYFDLTTGSKVDFMPITAFDLNIAGNATKPVISFNITEKITGTPKTGQILHAGQTFSDGRIALTKNAKLQLVAEFFIGGVQIRKVVTSKLNNVTIENFSATGTSFKLGGLVNPSVKSDSFSTITK